MKKSLIVGGYVRVSHEEQKKFGYSINAQTEEIKKWCDINNHTLYNLYIDEGYSASNMKRPELIKMLDDLPKLDVIIFTRLDRLSRNVFEANKILNMLKKNDTNMIAINEENIDTRTSNGMFMFNMKVTLAQHELDRGSERIKAVFEYKVREGQAVTGSLPFGYKIKEIDNIKRVVKDEAVEHIVKEIFEHFSTYGSIRGTCIYINKKHNLSKDYKTYARILKRDLYTGRYKTNSNYAPAYITEAQYIRNQELIKTNVKVRKTKNVYLFTGMIRCPKCNRAFIGKYYDGVSRYYAYVCCRNKGAKVCDFNKSISENKIEKFLIDNVEELFKIDVASVDKNIERLPDAKKVDAKKRIKEIKLELENLTYAFRKNRISLKAYDLEYEELEKELKKLEASTTSNKEKENMNKFFKDDWKDIYRTFDRDKKRALWNYVIKSISLDEDLNITINFR